MLTGKVIFIKTEVLKMTINKYFVFVPQAVEQNQEKENKLVTDKEAQRQALVKKAQQEGGL